MRLSIRLAAAALVVGCLSSVIAAPAVAACNEAVLTHNLVPLVPGSQILVHQQVSIPYSGMVCVLFNWLP